MSEGKVTVHIKYKDVEQTFSGSADDVWVNVNRFFSELVLAFDVARKVVLTVNLEKLVEDCKGIIGVASDGTSLLISRKKLTDSETLMLHLLANYIGHKLGSLKEDSTSKETLKMELGKTAKITSTRLGELVREGTVNKTEEGEYKITTKGIKQLQEDLPKIRMKN